MGWKRLLFPPANRTFPGKRWTRIGLRTVHLIGTAGVGGGFLYGAPREAWLPYLVVTVASGAGILLLELWTNGLWLIQLRGVAVLVKLALLAGVHAPPPWPAAVLVTSIVLSGVIAHAPGDVRYYSILHRRRLDTL